MKVNRKYKTVKGLTKALLQCAAKNGFTLSITGPVKKGDVIELKKQGSKKLKTLIKAELI